MMLSTTMLQAENEVVKPEVELTKGPLQPLQMPDTNQSILLGRSAFQAWPDPNKQDPRFEPIREGAFRIKGGTRQFNRYIVQGRNVLFTGEVPSLRVETTLGSGVYANDRTYPIFPRKDATSSSTWIHMGTGDRELVKILMGKCQQFEMFICA